MCDCCPHSFATFGPGVLTVYLRWKKRKKGICVDWTEQSINILADNKRAETLFVGPYVQMCECVCFTARLEELRGMLLWHALSSIL